MPLLPPSAAALDALSGGPVLVTGAGGSIGAALSLRLARLGLPRLVLLDACENNLYRLQQALAHQHSQSAPELVLALGDCADRATLDRLFSRYAPHLVFHTAAYKHVPLLEQQPFAAITNNIFATETVASAAARHDARVVFLSTDKAVRPCSVMGATKRVSEEVVLRRGGTALRLGNVLDSSGSVTEVFARQIAQGGPLTVTHPAVRRFFLTVEEAVNLLLAAAHVEPAALLAPALATDHGIAALAAFMARATAPHSEIAVRFTGLRPGDKLAEQMWDDGNRVQQAGAGLIAVHPVRPAADRFDAGLAALHEAVRTRDLGAALAQLQWLVPGFNPGSVAMELAQEDTLQVNA
jgi:FlaA1/EpsC-like NDP-sugar epimerase